MWDDSNVLMFDIFDLADDSETKFPIECPMCKKPEAHFFMHRFDARRGGAWAWCGGCHNFAHMSGLLPDWWENLQGIDGSLLSCDLDYLNGQAAKIDAYVNSLPRSTPCSERNDGESEVSSDVVICEKCGHEMAYFMEASSCGMTCTNCGWGWVTSYIEPIFLDETEYTLIIPPIKAPSADMLRYFSQLLMCNYIQAKARLNDEIIIKEKATKVREIARELITFNLDYTITPDYPYDIVEESK